MDHTNRIVPKRPPEPRLTRLRRREALRLRQNRPDHVPFHVREPEIPSAVAVGELQWSSPICCRMVAGRSFSVAWNPKSSVEPCVIPPFTPPPASNIEKP